LRTLRPRRGEGDPHPRARLTEALGGRVLEGEVGRRGGVLAELLLLTGHREAGRARANDEPRDGWAFGAGVAVLPGEDRERLRVRAVRDPLLRSGQPSVGVAGAHGARVGARAGLRESEGGDLLPAGERRHEALDLLAGSVGEDRHRARTDVDGERRADPGVTARELFEDERVGDEAGPGAAVFLGHVDPHQPELGELVEDLGREAVLAIPARRRGGDHLVGEPPGEITDLALFVAEVTRKRHGRAT
jgi:hypothetical protein